MAIPIRHELKYLLSEAQACAFHSVIKKVLKLDPNAAKNGGSYAIRSLYFDTIFDSALVDKLNGVANRQKYRIRLYNYKDDDIFLECKSKYESLISKRSLKIPKSLALQLMAADPTHLEATRSGLLQDVYREMKHNFLHPVVIVDYDRVPYLHPVENIRITLDSNLKTGLMSTDLFDWNLPTVTPFNENYTVLEVKYDKILPTYLQEILSQTVPEACRSAVSKYTWCRRYEGKGV